ncbi:MAG: SDR family oxidoreductase [Dehalococcoidales bacterium]|jgi:UDP-glucose 4-epimerase
MKKVVVTGGAGFIGSHLAEELAGRGYRVVVIDNLSTGKLANIDGLIKEKRIEFIQGSITDQPLLQEAFKDAAYVFHEAAIPSVPRSIDNPQASHEVNITGTLNVLLAASQNKVKKVVNASSSSVYGETPTLPKREDMTPQPLSPYAATKLAAEYYCSVFGKSFGLKTVSLRYFNVYGTRQAENSQYAAVIPTFRKNIAAGKAPVIYGDGEQTRDFTYIKDVVRANILAAESDAEGVYNISAGQGISINALARRLLETAGSDLEPIYKPPRAGDIKHSVADISKAAGFGYKPEYTFENGLKELTRSGYEKQPG